MKQNKKQIVRLTESQLKGMIAESVKKVLNEAKKAPKGQYFGGYFFEGIGWDINGNPIYYSNNLPLEAKKMLGWKKSKKWGVCGQADNWRVHNVLDKLGLPFGNEEDEYYNTLNIEESVNKVLRELDWKTCMNASLKRCDKSGYKSNLAQQDLSHTIDTAKKQFKSKEDFGEDMSNYFGGNTEYVKGEGWKLRDRE